jgi:hypothetical protein
LLELQGAQDRANALHDPDVQLREEWQSPEHLGGRGLGRQGLVGGNRPARERQRSQRQVCREEG